MMKWVHTVVQNARTFTSVILFVTKFGLTGLPFSTGKAGALSVNIRRL